MKIKILLLIWVVAICLFSTLHNKANAKHTAYGLVGDIRVDAEGHEHIIKALKDAKPGDEITLVIQSNGGSVQGAMLIIEAIYKSHAVVIAYVPNYARSAAALISCHVDVRIIGKKADVLYHLPRRYIITPERCTGKTDRDKGCENMTSYIEFLSLQNDPFAYILFDMMFENCKKNLTGSQLNEYYFGADVSEVVK